MEGTATVTLASFLESGTELLTWLIENAISMINSLMGNPVTACFLIIGLVGLVFTTYGRITGR